MARLSWIPEAAATVRDVYVYMARDRPETAFRTLESILNKVESLTLDPELGQSYPHADGGVRVLYYGSFRVPYLVEEDGGILVLGVFYGLIFVPPP